MMLWLLSHFTGQPSAQRPTGTVEAGSIPSWGTVESKCLLALSLNPLLSKSCSKASWFHCKMQYRISWGSSMKHLVTAVWVVFLSLIGSWNSYRGGHLLPFSNFLVKSLWLFFPSAIAKSETCLAPSSEASWKRVAALWADTVPARYKSARFFLNLLEGLSSSFLSERIAFLENIALCLWQCGKNFEPRWLLYGWVVPKCKITERNSIYAAGWKKAMAEEWTDPELAKTWEERIQRQVGLQGKGLKDGWNWKQQVCSSFSFLTAKWLQRQN